MGMIPGSIMLKVYKDAVSRNIFLTMNSFYHTLNSDGSKNIHKDNHGGDFTVELYDTMNLRGAWKLALVEMNYFGQRFANVPEEYGKIQLTSLAKELYNAHSFSIIMSLIIYIWKNICGKGHNINRFMSAGCSLVVKESIVLC